MSRFSSKSFTKFLGSICMVVALFGMSAGCASSGSAADGSKPCCKKAAGCKKGCTKPCGKKAAGCKKGCTKPCCKKA